MNYQTLAASLLTGVRDTSGAGSVACSGALSADRCGPDSDRLTLVGAGQYFWLVDE